MRTIDTTMMMSAAAAERNRGGRNRARLGAAATSVTAAVSSAMSMIESRSALAPRAQLLATARQCGGAGSANPAREVVVGHGVPPSVRVVSIIPSADLSLRFARCRRTRSAAWLHPTIEAISSPVSSSQYAIQISSRSFIGS